MVTETEKLVMTIPEAGILLGISRPQAYKCVRDGTIPVIKLGRRMVVPRPALMRMLENAGQPVAK